uniref:Uncharacterized protein n=1 Tax=Avena sativa TaxID=4498 RepID=A0ACD5X848_AVESA
MVMETSLRLRGADSTDVQPPRAADSTAGQRPRGRGANSTASQRSRGADSTAGQLGLRIHAKQKLPLAPNALLQAHAEIDTSTGKPSHLALLARHFFPELSANVGAGVQHENGKIFRYCIRGKKAVSFTSDALLGLNIKGRLLADKDFKPVLLHIPSLHPDQPHLHFVAVIAIFFEPEYCLEFFCRGR